MHGKNIEEVSDCQKRRKLAKFREAATKLCGLLEVWASVTAKTSSGKELLIPLGSVRGNRISTVSSSTSTSKTPTEGI